jgi:dUTP pyrophosphatase
MHWESKVLYPGEILLIPSGIKVEMPNDVCMLFVNKSSKGAVGLLTGAQLIDPDYRGEVHLNVVNSSKSEVSIKAGEKLMQALILPLIKLDLIEVKELSETERGNGGFGSTGKF